jgi:3-oxoacyl-[acyl-carrier protein] reductase
MNILVTGCSRGVGLEICRILLSQGHTVYGIARSNPQEFKDLQAQYPMQLHY